MTSVLYLFMCQCYCREKTGVRHCGLEYAIWGRPRVRWVFEGEKMEGEIILAWDINKSMKLGIESWEEVC